MALICGHLTQQCVRGLGDRDDAIPLMRAAVDHLVRGGQLLGWAFMRPLFWWRHCWTAAADGGVAEAAIERLSAAPTDDGLAIRAVTLLRLRALLARARGDDTGYRDYRDRY